MTILKEFTRKFTLNIIKDYLQKPYKLEEVSKTLFRVKNENTKTNSN